MHCNKNEVRPKLYSVYFGPCWFSGNRKYLRKTVLGARMFQELKPIIVKQMWAFNKFHALWPCY